MKALLAVLSITFGLLIAIPAAAEEVSTTFRIGEVGSVIYLCKTLDGIETIRELTSKETYVSPDIFMNGMRILTSSGECGRLPGLMPFRLTAVHFSFVDWEDDYIVAGEGYIDVDPDNPNADKTHYFSPLVDNKAHPKNEI
tara:strand:- start:507 stop:929 length:423 start_codon:yes stop_codon:yes gene_type:complete